MRFPLEGKKFVNIDSSRISSNAGRGIRYHIKASTKPQKPKHTMNQKRLYDTITSHQLPHHTSLSHPSSPSRRHRHIVTLINIAQNTAPIHIQRIHDFAYRYIRCDKRRHVKRVVKSYGSGTVGVDGTTHGEEIFGRFVLPRPPDVVEHAVVHEEKGIIRRGPEIRHLWQRVNLLFPRRGGWRGKRNGTWVFLPRHLCSHARLHGRPWIFPLEVHPWQYSCSSSRRWPG